MENEGLTESKILKILEEKLARDLTYDSGFILGSMCSEPFDFSKKVYKKYLSKNLGDPGLFKGTAELEKELIKEIGELYGGKNIVGSFTTGGSEANIIAMRIAKKLRPDIKKPEIVVPASAHASFDKSGDLLGLKVKKAKLKEDFELDLNHFESLINENTCGVVGIAGTTSLGLIDPIQEIGKIIDGRDVFFHVDAAFGAFILPFLKELGHDIPLWDFSVNSVCSITADPHKMGMGIIPSGGIFLRDYSLLQRVGFDIPYLAGGNFKHLHLVGTRSGAPIIAFWALLKHLGMNGFKKMVKTCMENTQFVIKRVNEIEGIKLAADPLMNIVGLTTENGESMHELDMELREKNWMTGKFEAFNLIRIVIMPHVKREHLSKFLKDLEDILKKTRSS